MRTDQNELWERYEDAMFTLLMDEVAHQEGQEQLEWKKQLNLMKAHGLHTLRLTDEQKQ